MKEYGCCPKFKRGGNSTYTFTKRSEGMYLVSATPTKLPIDFLLFFIMSKMVIVNNNAIIFLKGIFTKKTSK
jgi:hypothetical protein